MERLRSRSPHTDKGNSQSGLPRLCVVGASFTDLVVYVPRFPGPGETLVGDKFAPGFGGKGANQAVQCARLGGNVLMVSKVGDDVFGENYLRNYKDQGIDSTYVSQEKGISSGVAPIAVNVNTAENSIVIVPGACGLISPSDIEQATPGIKTCSLMLCQLEIPIEANIAALKAARSSGLTTILNTAPVPKDGLPEEIWSLCDIVCPNEPELQMLTGMPTETDIQVQAAAAAVIDKGAKTVLVTLGPRGAALIERPSSGGACSFKVVPCPKVKAKDTTGAGDSFLGALAYQLLQQVKVEEAIRLACEVASVSVQREGTQTSFPTAMEMKSR